MGISDINDLLEMGEGGINTEYRGLDDIQGLEECVQLGIRVKDIAVQAIAFKEAKQSLSLSFTYLEIQVNGNLSLCPSSGSHDY